MGHQAAGRAIAAADFVFCMTRLDVACVQPLIGADHGLVFLPPFLDAVPFLEVEKNRKRVAQFYGVDPSKYWLLAVGMMRPGDKLQSYQRLGASLRHLDRDDMQLLVLGDGAARSQVVEALAPVRDRTKLYGAYPFLSCVKFIAVAICILGPVLVRPTAWRIWKPRRPVCR